MKELKRLKEIKKKQHNCRKRSRWDPKYTPIKNKIRIPNSRQQKLSHDINIKKRKLRGLDWNPTPLKRRKPQPPDL